MAVIVITDQTTRAELAALITAENYQAKRAPRHWPAKKAHHDRINALLTDWEAASDPCD